MQEQRWSDGEEVTRPSQSVGGLAPSLLLWSSLASPLFSLKSSDEGYGGRNRVGALLSFLIAPCNTSPLREGPVALERADGELKGGVEVALRVQALRGSALAPFLPLALGGGSRDR